MDKGQLLVGWQDTGMLHCLLHLARKKQRPGIDHEVTLLELLEGSFQAWSKVSPLLKS